MIKHTLKTTRKGLCDVTTNYVDPVIEPVQAGILASEISQMRLYFDTRYFYAIDPTRKTQRARSTAGAYFENFIATLSRNCGWEQHRINRRTKPFLRLPKLDPSAEKQILGYLSDSRV
jgi:hypothetical protein